MLRNFCRFGRTHRKPSRARIAEIQQLEPRTLPAGIINVTVAANGDVTVTGDNNDNGITVDVTSNDVSVTGNDRTRVRFNGQLHGAGETIVIDEFDEAAFLGALTIDMKGGDDNVAVNINNVALEIGRNLTVNLGDGDDSLRLESFGETKLTVDGDVKLMGGDGADRIIVVSGDGSLPELVLNKSLTIDLGDGVNILGLGRDHQVTGDELGEDDLGLFEGDPAFFDFGLFTGEGLGNVTVKGDVRILGGDSVDAIGLGIFGNVDFQKSLQILTGAGADFLECKLDGDVVTVRGDLKIDTQGDSDLVFLKFGEFAPTSQSVHFAKNLTINTGSGEDLVSIALGSVTTVTVGGETKINTGDGYDAILMQNSGQAIFQKSLDVNAGTGHALVNLQSNSSESSLSVGGNLKITTGSLTDFIFVGDALIQIGGELKIDSGSGSDFVGIGFGSVDAVLDEGVVNSVGKDVKINTGNGSDEVLIEVRGETNLKGKLEIRTGAQSDHVSIEASAPLTIDKDVRIDTGNHSDRVTFTSTETQVLLKGRLDVNLGNEDDCLRLGDALGVADGFTVTGDVNVVAGAGDDVILVDGVTANRDLIVDGGNGNDAMAIGRFGVGRDLIVNGGAGNDDIEISFAIAAGIARDLRINTGAGNDRVLTEELLIGRNVDVRLGAGDDQFSAAGVLLSGANPSVRVDGGAGTDFGSTNGFARSDDSLPPLNINLVSITEDDIDVDQNGDGNPIEVDAVAVREDIGAAIAACFADELI